MYGRRRSLLFGGALSILSLLYRAIIDMRHALYRHGILKSKALPCKVISVGNITLGGTGKTPMVVSIAGLLAQKQKHPVVVSRGYGRKNEAEILVVSDGKAVLTDTRTGGDEPVLIGSRLSGIPVVAGSKRYEAAQYAFDRFDPDTVVLDDGFQHLGLRRDLDIVLVDATDPFGNGRLFPAGILREPLTALRRAQAVIITKADQSVSLEALKKRIQSVAPARIFTSFQRPADLIDDRTGDVKPLSVLRGTKVLAFSGIARPESFSALLRSLGAVLAGECIYPDHHEYAKTDLAAVFKKAADERGSMIVTTEKDAVRLRSLKPEGIWALRIELAIEEREEWETFLLNSL